MAEFSRLDAAFTGFRIVRERPRAAATWAALQIIATMTYWILVTLCVGPAFTSVMAFGPGQDPRQFATLMAGLWPAYVATLIFVLGLYPVVLAAINRAVMRPAEHRLGYLRLGIEELRQLGLMLILLAIAIAAYVSAILLAVLFGLAVGPASRIHVLAFSLVVGLFGAFAFLGVRLSLAPALTFATGKIDLAGSWRMTRGRFWPILVVYALAAGLAAVVWFLSFAVISAVVAVVGGGAGALAVIVHPDFSSLGAIFSPARLTYLVLQAALSGLFWPLLLSPPAAIYKSLAAGRPSNR